MKGRMACIDLEWATSVPGNICELGVVWFEDGREVQRFRSLVRPIVPAWGAWQYLNLPYGLEEALAAPGFGEIWRQLLPDLRGVRLVAHNAAEAECKFLGGALAHHGLGWELGEGVHCSLALAKRVWPEARSHGLKVIASELDLPLEHHNPESDARVSGLLVLRAAAMAGAASWEELDRRFHWSATPVVYQVPELPEVDAGRRVEVFGQALVEWESPVAYLGPKPGGRFVLSGLSESEKHRLRQIGLAHGLRPVTAVAGNVHVVVAGSLMGPSKWARCQKWGIPIVTVEQWLASLGAGEP
ncbi:MAG: polymerase subunit epsilon [Bacteroidota bacterium]|jgi:DNA polymerase III epsilon subunit-like protein